MKTNNIFQRAIIAVVITTLATLQAWAQSFEVDNIQYTVTSEENFEVSVIGHTFSGDNGTIDIVVPPTVKNEGNTYTVTAIGDGAFRGLYATRTVKLSSSIKSIGNDSFYDNYFLEEIEFNEGLESIGTHAFGYNWRMKDIILPSTLRTIGSIAFNSCGQYCEEDHKLILPEDLTIIYDGAFQYCDHITEVYCYAPIPPTFEGSPFTNTNEHATLYVPASFIDSYQNADIWNSFSGGIQTVDHTYTRCITPVISLKDFQVTISSYPGDASIYYTVDGSTPSTDNGILYTEPFFPESDCVIKAIAVKDGLGNSSISQLALDLRVPLPDISMDEDFNITITCSLPDVTIYYIIRTDNGWNTSNDGNGGVADMVVSDLLNAEDVKVYDGSFPMPYFGHVYAESRRMVGKTIRGIGGARMSFDGIVRPTSSTLALQVSTGTHTAKSST